MIEETSLAARCGTRANRTATRVRSAAVATVVGGKLARTIGNDRMLSAATVAKQLGVHADTVREWCRLDLINHFRTCKGGYRIPIDTLNTLLANKKTR